MPDLATVRDKAKTKWKRILYGIGSLGWRGSAMHWQRHQSAYLLLAGLATPLVLSVHSVVSFDFSIAQLPGWHSTIFPPYFVAGAIYSGFAMVLNIIIPIRRIYGLRKPDHDAHAEQHGVRDAGHLLDGRLRLHHGGVHGVVQRRSIRRGHDARPRLWGVWLGLLGSDGCSMCVIPQLLWSRKVRTNDIALFFVALSANVGMWVERFVIVVQSLHHDFVPSSLGHVLSDRLGLGDAARQRRACFSRCSSCSSVTSR